MTAPRTPPEGWIKTTITEYKPAGCPPPGSIWWTDPDSGASTPITDDEDEAIRRAWALKARMEGMAAPQLKAPFPYFGGKSRIAADVWERFGTVDNYVEPFFGSGAVLLQCPAPGHTETVNDADGLLANFWRALQAAPDEVAAYADYPVSELDLHARHRWLVRQRADVERLLADPAWYDAQIAGWWVWGISQWIGSGWCDTAATLRQKRPAIGGRGHPSSVGGVHRVTLAGAYTAPRMPMRCASISRNLRPACAACG